MKRLNIILSIFFVFLSIDLAKADLVTDVSKRHIEINTTFKGESVLLFGSFKKKANLNKARYDIVISVTGPNKPLTLYQKVKKNGIWVNSNQKNYSNIPSYYWLLSNRPLEEISDKTNLTKLGLGLKYFLLKSDNLRQRVASSNSWSEYDKAAIRLKKLDKLYLQTTEGVKLIGNGLFRSNIEFPADIDVGKYQVNTYLFADNKLVSENHTYLSITKHGFNNQLASFAKRYPWYHGILAVLFALIMGWSSAIIFKKN